MYMLIHRAPISLPMNVLLFRDVTKEDEYV